MSVKQRENLRYRYLDRICKSDVLSQKPLNINGLNINLEVFIYYIKKI